MYKKDKILGGFAFCDYGRFLSRTYCVQYARVTTISIRLKVKCIR